MDLPENPSVEHVECHRCGKSTEYFSALNIHGEYTSPLLPDLYTFTANYCEGCTVAIFQKDMKPPVVYDSMLDCEIEDEDHRRFLSRVTFEYRGFLIKEGKAVEFPNFCDHNTLPFWLKSILEVDLEVEPTEFSRLLEEVVVHPSPDAVRVFRLIEREEITSPSRLGLVVDSARRYMEGDYDFYEVFAAYREGDRDLVRLMTEVILALALVLKEENPQIFKLYIPGFCDSLWARISL